MEPHSETSLGNLKEVIGMPSGVDGLRLFHCPIFTPPKRQSPTHFKPPKSLLPAVGAAELTDSFREPSQRDFYCSRSYFGGSSALRQDIAMT